MKTVVRRIITLSLLLSVVVCIQGCRDMIFEKLQYNANVPVYMEFNEFRSAITTDEVRMLQKLGRIKAWNGFLFINEAQQGIHVFDIRNAAAPRQLTFIAIPGNNEFAIHGNSLIADTYIDLVVLDISQADNPRTLQRLEDIFPNMLPLMDVQLPIYGLDFKKGVVVEWKTKDITEVVDKDSEGRAEFISFNHSTGPQIGDIEVGISATTFESLSSMGGFESADDYLYIAHNDKLIVLEAQNPKQLICADKLMMHAHIGSIQRIEDYLFVGSMSEMHVYDIENPKKPYFMAVMPGLAACDQVEIFENHAVALMRTDNNCTASDGYLQTFELVQPFNPNMSDVLPIRATAIAKSENALFVGMADGGLNVYKPETQTGGLTLSEMAAYSEIHVEKLFVEDEILFVVGGGKLSLFEIIENFELQLLSTIGIMKS